MLEHIVGEAVTIPADRGVFLSQTRRMHPDVCRFISEEIYDGRLGWDSSCEQRARVAGTGLRGIRAGHNGNNTSSEQEAELITQEIRQLVGTSWTTGKDDSKSLAVNDFMVVASTTIRCAVSRHASTPILRPAEFRSARSTSSRAGRRR